MDRASLSEALASVAAQSYPAIEVVLVNAKGAVHADVGPLCGRFPIRLINSCDSLARSAAANVGLTQARGDFLIFLDDDDLMDADHIASLVTTLASAPHCKAAFSGTRVTDAAGATVGVYDHVYSQAQLLIGNFLPIHAVLFSRELVESGCRFDTTLDTYEDWDFWLQIAQHTAFAPTGGVTAVYRSFLGDSGMSRAEDRPLQRQRRSLVWRKWWPVWGVENVDLLASGLERAMEDKQRESEELRKAFDEEVAKNSQLHHGIAGLQRLVGEQAQQVARLDHTVAELRAALAGLHVSLADRDRAIAVRDVQINALNTSIQDILTSTSWRWSAPIRHVGRAVDAIRRKVRAAGLLAHLSVQFLRRDSVVTQIRRVCHFVVQEGWSGIKQRLAQRAPAAATEHPVSTQGLDASPLPRSERHNHQPLSSIDTDKYEVFFFDVFDTAIIRLFEKPVDLFKHMGHTSRVAKFESLRIQQERTTREKHSTRRDVKLAEIYRGFFGADLGAEIAAELTFCAAHPDTLAFYADLVSKGKKIYFVSDMYLDRETIAAILHKNGFKQYEDIFVSSEDDLIKGDGSRFAWLKTSLPGSVGRAIHIGDNHVSDWVQPRQHGYDAFQYLESIEFYRHDDFLFSKAPHLVAQDSLGVSFTLGMFRYWKSGFLDSKPSYWRQFGFFYGGALVAAFCAFVNSTLRTRQLSTSRVFFLARDGDIMSQVCRLLYPELDAVYVWASRRCMSFPSLRTMQPSDDEDMIKLFTTPIGITCADDVMERLGYDDLPELKAALSDLEARGLLDSEPDILRCLVDHKDTLLPKARAERDTLLHYLDAVNFFGDSDIVIADVGWGGTIQNALVKLMKESGSGDQRLHGIYMGVSDGVAHQDFKTGFLFQGDRSRFVGFLNLIELITSSPKDGVMRVAQQDGSFVPVGVKQTADEASRQSIAAEIQTGILEFAQIVKDKKIGALDFFQPADFEALFGALQEHPSEEDVAHLGGVRHAMTLGSHFGEQVLNKKG
ncbi:glycosyltransferase [Rhodoferax sp. AJA081-3]|uniref:glycosyltransferase n=1 Tax=Rhodoferax sp. AJA081-3 TaxID=2752316 RepID=UPI001AE05C83|nr:glycosyltransferase [Rhodoferax sp. AJA081-3]QTN27397.1 glycosyltransferase [Rhodoferax sp. AJA081-3]